MHCTKISPEFECQGQRSKLKVIRDKNVLSSADAPQVRTYKQRAAATAGPFRGCQGMFSGTCVRCMFS